MSHPAPAPSASAESPRTRSWWGDRSVKTKILTNVGIAAVVAGSIGALGMSGMSQAADDSALLYSSNLLGSIEAANMDNLLQEMRVASRNALLAETPDETAEKLAQLDELHAEFADTVDAYMATGMDPRRQVLIDEIHTQIAEYAKAQDEVLAPLAEAHDVPGW